MPITIQSLARHASNLVMVLLLAAFAFALWLGDGRLSPDWMRLLGGGALIGFGLHLCANCGAKARRAVEVTPEMRQKSYAIGYWVAVVSILGAIAGAHWGLIRADTALPLLALSLIAPSLSIGWSRFRS